MTDMTDPASRADAHSFASSLTRAARAVRVGMLFLIALVVAPLSVFIGNKRTATITRWWYGQMLRALGIEVRIHGETLHTPALFVANHCSWLDILALGHAFGAAFISKAEVDGWPVIGTYARVTDTVFLARGAYRTGDARAQIQARFARNHSVVLFAEGTTSTSPAPTRFHARLFSVALDGRHPVLPIALRYSDATTPTGAHHPLVPWVETSLLSNFIQVFRLSGLRVDLHVCAAIAPDGHTRRSLATATRNAIIGQIQRGAKAAPDNA